ncbi:MFS transporter [Thermogymnomonas acidicola]|uniref:MFS transporter n=1 Tax=Thermogymnomonas acidicola TaxID=399579 RepID=A0AA37BQG6_9ARCH|nr:MFS transporter [Thermogymnomonas acidicola]GGM70531.1 MFS transporter [Thermogymnomonas acidicola]
MNTEAGRGAYERKWFASYLLSNVASGIISPLVPLYTVLLLHSTVFYVGLASALSSAASVPSLILWGNLSDRTKARKPFIIVGFAGSFLSLILILLVRNVYDYIGVLVLYQVLANASVPVATVLIAENTEERLWPNVMAMFNMLSAVGTVIGLGLGTMLTFINSSPGALTMVYVYSSAIYLVSAISAALLLRESEKKLERRRLSSIFSIRVLERNRFSPSHIVHFIAYREGNARHLPGKLWATIACACLLMVGFQVFLVPYPVYLVDRYGASQLIVFLMYMGNSAMTALTYVPAGRMVRKSGISRALSLALGSRILIFSASSVIAMLAAPTHLWMYVMVAFYSIIGGLWSFIGMGQVTAVTRMADQETRGWAVGLYNSFLGIGQIAGSFISGYMAQYVGYSYDFIAAAAIVVVGTAVILRMNIDSAIRGQPGGTGVKPGS